MSAAIAVHHVVEGPAGAPALVLSNSLGSTLEVWDRQMAALVPHFRVIRYDLRGHGVSPVPPGPYDIADLGADVLALLDVLGVDRTHVGGVSIGGQIGMWIAANAPDRVDRLVLCCTAPRFEPPEAWAARAATVRAEGTAAIADAVVARWFTPAFSAEFPGFVREMRDMIASTPPEGYAACCGVVERTDLRPSLSAIHVPTLVIAGAEDPAAPPAQAERIAGEIPGARLAVVDRAAHLANVERSDEVNTLILEHLLDNPTFDASTEDAPTKEAP
ncbi:MAG: 3-oxoadipate enol-lactonase [Actinomycetota bacterium]